MGSSYITFGKNGKIELESPKIELRIYHNVKLHPNGGTILAGKDVTFYREGVGVILPTAADVFKEYYNDYAAFKVKKENFILISNEIKEYEKAGHIWFIEKNTEKEIIDKGYQDLLDVINK